MRILMLTLIFLFCLAPASLVSAKTKRTTITVTSHHGHGTLRVPIRKHSKGWQARLPRGTWIWCEGDCEEAVRFQYLDFWERQRELTAHIGP